MDKRFLYMFIFIAIIGFVNYGGEIIGYAGRLTWKKMNRYFKMDWTQESCNKTHIMLIYHKPWGTTTPQPVGPGLCGDDIKCMTTYDRKYFDDAEAVVLHFSEIKNLESIPKRRDSDQLYLWWCREKNLNQNLDQFADTFNMTFTYRSNSDIYGPYDGIHQVLHDIKEQKRDNLSQLLSIKSNDKIAVWAVSNCRCKRRLQIAQELIDNGIEVQRFGKCFNNRQLGDGKFSYSMYDEISEYKFYLSFENAYHCKEYITEKLWQNGFLAGAVPIYWGARKEEVERVAPKHSFIYVDDFPSVSELAEYIKYLTRNDTAYAEYHQWRKWVNHHELIEKRFMKDKHIHYNERGFCTLCRFLHERSQKRQAGIKPEQYIVKSLQEFWHGQQYPECSETLDGR